MCMFIVTHTEKDEYNYYHGERRTVELGCNSDHRTDIELSYLDWMIQPENIDSAIPRYEVAALIRNIEALRAGGEGWYRCVLMQNVKARYFDKDYSYENPYYAYINAINYCYDQGYLNGKNDVDGFDGWANLTRAEGATISVE